MVLLIRPYLLFDTMDDEDYTRKAIEFSEMPLTVLPEVA
jgi:hypothetical protein